MKIYLDVCCLNRPFDDQAQNRIAIETAAIVRILELIDVRTLSDYSSEMARIEIEHIPDPDRRRKVKALLPPGSRTLSLTTDLLDAAEKIARHGFGLTDAVHVAAAKAIGVDVFLTVDDNLLKRAKKHRSYLGVKVSEPVLFLQELKDEHDR